MLEIYKSSRHADNNAFATLQQQTTNKHTKIYSKCSRQKEMSVMHIITLLTKCLQITCITQAEW
jgi:hypothetical protein